MRNLIFVVLAVMLLVALVGLLLRHYLGARRQAQDTWEDLLKRLTWVDRQNIAMVAMDVITESGEPREEENSLALAPSSIWTLLGGIEGVEAMEQNCQVLVELAAYVQRWHPEALAIAEQLRLNARELEWHIGRLKGAAQTGHLQQSFADYAQRAAVIYYLMTRHVLNLYEQARMPRLSELQQAI